MSDLHEMVGDEVMRVLEDGVTANEVAARILAAVREALLAPEAVESTGRKIWEHGGYCNSYESIADSMNRSVRATITAALDAALGGDGHE